MDPTKDTAQDTLTMLSEIESAPAEAQSQPAAEGNTGIEQPTQAVQVDPKEAELEALRRLIAMDPQKRHQYEIEKYGESSVKYQPVQSQPQEPQYQQPIQQQPQAQSGLQLPFDPSEYDPTNAEHQIGMMAAIMQHQLGQQLAPAMTYIQHLQQQEAAEQMNAVQGQYVELDKQIHKSMDSFVPGFSEWAVKPKSDEEIIVREIAYSKFKETLQNEFPPNDVDQFGRPFNSLWKNPKVHADILQRIGPNVKSMASRLGIVNKAASGGHQADQGMHVEPSSAVPATTRNSFDEAHKKGDIYGMLSAL